MCEYCEEDFDGYGASTIKKWDLCNECYQLLCDFINEKRQITRQEILNLFPVFEKE